MENKEIIHSEQSSRTEDYSTFHEGRTEIHFTERINTNNIDTTARTSPAISNLITGSMAFRKLENSLELNIPNEGVIVDATLLENFGNHQQTSDPSLLLIEETQPSGTKRKDTSCTPSKKKVRRLSTEDDLLSDSGDSHYDDDDDDEENGQFDQDEDQYEGTNWSFPLPPTFEPLPISITLPFLRSYATKKFDAPIPLFVPPILPVGQLHHFPSLLTLPPFFQLPTAVSMYPQSPYLPASYYPFTEDDFPFSQDDSEDSMDEEEGDVLDESLISTQQDTPLKGSQIISPLTTLASLASGSVSTEEKHH